MNKFVETKTTNKQKSDIFIRAMKKKIQRLKEKHDIFVGYGS